MTLQEVYVTYMKNSGENFLKNAGETARLNRVKALFAEFCDESQKKVKSKARVQETVEM